jgi:hypothetical protein
LTTKPNEFEQFMMLFGALKHEAGTPRRLATFHDESANLQNAVRQFESFLWRTDFERRVFAAKKVFKQVPEKFESDWKAYEREWAPALSYLTFRDIFPEEFGTYDAGELGKTEPRELRAPDPHSEPLFNPLRHDGGAALDRGIGMIDHELDGRESLLEKGLGSEDDEYIANVWRITRGAYDYLRKTIGLDLTEVFRRWQTVPPFFMPARVSNRHGDEKGSLNDLLDDAIRAYICGAPAAAIAMCRAALELVLKEHYFPKDHQYRDKNGKLRDKPLGELIVLADEKSQIDKRFKHIQKGRIEPISERANGILHRYSRRSKITDEDERDIINFLKTVKFLINRAPF